MGSHQCAERTFKKLIMTVTYIPVLSFDGRDGQWRLDKVCIFS